jgi:8-oxo-dGTP pyrophosphatase MutT (NUDIX family)/tetratricopeptide (TPR) repeat protein
MGFIFTRGRQPGQEVDRPGGTGVKRCAKNTSQSPQDWREGLVIGHELEDAIIEQYPCPIATPYRALVDRDRRSAVEAFTFLLTTVEGLLHYLATVVVSAYLRSGINDSECNRGLLEKMVKNGWTIGDLFWLLERPIKIAGDFGGVLPYAELPGYLFQAPRKPSPSYHVLDSFVRLRNSVVHPIILSEEMCRHKLASNRIRLEEELARLQFLTDWQLIRPVSIDDSGVVRKADLLMGDRRRRDREYELVLNADDLPENGGEVRAEKSLLLVSPDFEKYLPLFPLSLFGFKLRCESLFFLNRPFWRRESKGRILHKARYVAYEPDVDKYEEGPGELATRSLERIVRVLERKCVEPLDISESQDDPDVELPQVRLEQESHLRAFVGREPFLTSVSEWIARDADGGYLLVLGAPGQGKSALMAKLAERESEGAGCLLHMVKSHRNPLRFLPSLIRQAAQLLDTPLGQPAYQGDTDDLRNSLLKVAGLLRHKTGRALIIIDALDELECAAQRLDFLPPSVPAGVRVVLTCRPDIPLIQELRARLQQLEEWPLPPLVQEDVRDFFAQHLGADAVGELQGRIDWTQLFQRIQGNPLMLRAALPGFAKTLEKARLEDSVRQIDLDSLPATLGAFFHDAYREIVGGGGVHRADESSRHRARLLQFLCLAREPLGFEQLAELLQADGKAISLEDCRDRVFEMSQFLLDAGGNRFAPWHQGLVDFVREDILGASGVRETEAVFCRTLRKCMQFSPYFTRHEISHLVAADSWDELEGRLTDPDFIERNCQDKMIFGLVDGLAAMANSGRPLHQVASALVAIFHQQADWRFWLRLRSALNRSFGPYDMWPLSLRQELGTSDHYHGLLFLAGTHDMEERFDDAERVLQRLLEIVGPGGGERYCTVCIELALVLEHQGRYADALSRLNRAIEQPDAQARYGEQYWRLQHHRGNQLRRLGRLEEAQKVLRDIRQKAAGRDLATAALHHLAVIDLTRGQTMLDQFPESSDSPQHPARKHFESARQTLGQCLQEWGDDPWIVNRAYEFRRLGQVYALAGLHSQAGEQFSRAVEVATVCGSHRYVRMTWEDISRFLLRPYLADRPDELLLSELARNLHISQSNLGRAFCLLESMGLHYLEVIDPDSGEPTGRLVEFGHAHKVGRPHATVAVLIADERSNIALQERGETDSQGRLDVSVAGHVGVRESATAAALRETREEVGLTVSAGRLGQFKELWKFEKEGSPNHAADFHEGPYRYVYRTCGRVNRERQTLFLLRVEAEDKARITPTGKHGASSVQWRPCDEARQEALAEPDRFASGFKQLLHPEVWQEICRYLG